MNFKKLWALSACLFLCFMLISLALPFRASADSFYLDGYYTLEINGFPNTNFYSPFSTPVVDSGVSVPSGYSLIGYYMDCGYSSPVYPFEAYYVYGIASDSPFYLGNQYGSVVFRNSSGSSQFFSISNYIDSSGNVSFRNSGYFGELNSSRLVRFTAFTDTINSNGVINRPESQISFNLNTCIIDYNLAFNCNINSGGSGTVDYYLFPSSVSVPSGSSSGFSNVPATELSVEEQQSLISRGYSWIIERYSDVLKGIKNTIVPSVTSYTVSSTRGGSGSFNPDSFNASYVKLGTSRLYSSGELSSSTSGSLDLKAILSYHTGVYASPSLKLVAVTHLENRYFTATYDFNPSAIVGDSPSPPTTIQNPSSYPDFVNPNSDFKELADYLKDLMQTNNQNSITNNSNLLANLMAIPWSNFIGTGFANGFANVMPELSFSLDSLFDSLFDKYSAPSSEQINSLIADVTEERAYIRQKLAFVADVKQEVFFIQSTFVSAGDNPRPFTVTLPAFMMGNKVHGHQEALVRYDLISENTRQAMHNVIIVFCSLAVVMHIWRTLPSTVGNMPRD